MAAQPAVPAGADTGPVVFAAASKKTALEAVAAAWNANSGKTASIVYASSAVLAKQIERGAPADIFISAVSNGWIISKKPSSSAQEHGVIS